MKKGMDPSPDQAELRRRAEARVANKTAQGCPTPEEEDTRRFVHELQVHQVELEMQNEELLQARQKLEISLERYTDLYDFAPVGYFTLDRQGKIREANLAGAALLNSVRSRAVDQGLAGFLSHDSQAAYQDFLKRMREGNTKQSCQVMLAMPGQEPCHLHIEGAPVGWSEAGESRAREGHVRLAALDITERKLAEEGKARLEIQLRHAQKMQAIGTLTGGLAHEFNNLLGMVMGFAELAMELGQQREDNIEEIGQIIQAADRASALVRQMLTFSRKTGVDKKPLSLNNSVIHAGKMLERTLPRTISIEMNLAPDLPPVGADGSQVEQVLINLATNARDAMPEGGKLSISTELVSTAEAVCDVCGGKFSGDYVLLKVTDAGHGMVKKIQEQMYEPFFSTKGVGKGTGLGLSVVLGLVQDHGGHINCESKPDVGTTFKVYLPVLRGEAMGTGNNGQPPHEQAPGGSETVLLVDDEESLRSLGARIFGKAGYQVMKAGSGEEALEMYRAKWGEIALVVLDLGMPGMGGQRCLKEILAINSQAKVVIASGYNADTQVKESLGAGSAAFVAKPYKRDDLLATVRDVLNQSGS
ncbi:MAG: response regulator [Pseudomonadota bacterium]